MNTKGIIEAIRSGVSGIHIQGQDFFRVDEEIEFVANQLNFKICEWNWGYGWVDFKTKRSLKPDDESSLYDDLKSIADDDPTQRIYVIKNAYSALKNDPRAVARLQQEILRIKLHFQGVSAIFFIGKESLEHSDLTGLFVSFPCPPLASREVEETFESFSKQSSIGISTEAKASLVSICSGMEQNTVLQIFNELKNLNQNPLIKESVENIALAVKKRALSQSGLLELVDTSIGMNKVGGLEQLKSWLTNKKRIIDDLPRAENFGVSAPKGALLAGMPGCGKSMSAKAAASLFNVPLLRLDIGSLMGKFVGESEANMKAALSVAEKASPCVLWIDELEKAFSGVNDSGGSTDITTRLFGYFLTWMQEKPGAVFVIATANDITTIPPELLRRGRFDEIFFIDLPNHHERKQIFEVKVNEKSSVGIDKELDFTELADNSDGYSGADIESVINDALEDMFRKGNDVLTQDILKKHIGLVIPISDVLEEKIANYRELFKKFCLKPASFSEEDIKRLVSKVDSGDASERENAASFHWILPNKLLQLVRDDNFNVRSAALKNPKCPIEALKHIVDAYEQFDFSKSGSWSKGRVFKEEFELALKHRNISGQIIVDLYERQKINPEQLLWVAHKLTRLEQTAVFKEAKVKLPRSIKSGTVQNICCSKGDIVKPADTIIEIDNEKGSTQRVTASIDGFVSEVFANVGECLSASEEIALILVPKSKE